MPDVCTIINTCWDNIKSSYQKNFGSYTFSEYFQFRLISDHLNVLIFFEGVKLQILSEVQPTFVVFFLVEFSCVSYNYVFFFKNISTYVFFWRVKEVCTHAAWTSDFIWSSTNFCCFFLTNRPRFDQYSSWLIFLVKVRYYIFFGGKSTCLAHIKNWRKVSSSLFLKIHFRCSL